MDDTEILKISAREQGRRAALLALVAGYGDACTFLNYKLYVSFMSGNTTQTGAQLGQAKTHGGRTRNRSSLARKRP